MHPGGEHVPRQVAALLAAAGTALFVVGVYGIVVVGGALLLGTRAPSLPLAVLATAIVAVAVEPVRRALSGRLAPSSEALLADFARHVSGPRTAEELGPDMARLLAEGTSARRVEVWQEFPAHPGTGRLIGRWPADSEPVDPHGPAVYEHWIVSAGDRLGRVLRDCPGAGGMPSGTTHAVEERLLGDLLAAAGLALRSLALTADLEERIAQTRVQAAELLASRRRIVASADAARERLERDVHDGAQQQLVALALNLSRAAVVTGRDPGRAAPLIGALHPAAAAALETLGDLSRGIYPAALAGSGLGSALRAASATSPVPVLVQDETAGRFPAEVEAAAYFGCLESLQNALKYACADQVRIRLRQEGGALVFGIQDDGAGFDPATVGRGTGLGHLRDRLEGLGGSVTVASRPGAGTTVTGRLPAVPGADRSAPQAQPAALPGIPR